MNRTRKKWEDCKVFLMCTLLVLLLAFGFLFFFIPGKILDAIRMRQYRKRRERTRWQPQVSDEDFLRGCGISPDSPGAEVALDLRRKLAQAALAWCHKITAEEIAPDMTCGELVLGWSSYMYWHDGLESIGCEVLKKTVTLYWICIKLKLNWKMLISTPKSSKWKIRRRKNEY